MGLRFHGVHEIVERHAIETIVAKKLQYNFFKN
jgi:ribosomal protein S12 methylthiotransferase accessory factor YcaO